MDPTQIYPNNIAGPPQPAQPPGALDKIGSFLSHPAVQGLLGAYFGAVSSPRHGGFGTAIGRGGIGGLEMMDQATALRQQQQALAQRTTQQGQLMGLREREVGAKEKALGTQQKLAQANIAAKQPIGLPKATSIVAGQPTLQKAGLSPELISDWTEDMVRKEIDALRTTGQHDPLIASEIARNQAEASAATQRVGIEGAGIGLKQRELAQQKQLGEERIGVERDAIAARGGQQKQEQARNKSYADLYKAGLTDYVKNHPQHLWGLVGGGTPEEAAAYATNVANAGVAGFTAGSPSPTAPTAPAAAPAGGPGTAAAAEVPPHATTGEGLPHGSKPNGDGTWTLPDGTKVKPLG